jgi:anti-sigma factor RsiW
MEVDTCRELIENLLSSYVDGELDNHTAQSLELHMQMCPPCTAFLRTFIAAQKAARKEAVRAMSVDCEASLWDFLEREAGVAPPPDLPKIENPCGCCCGSNAKK